MQGLAKIFHGLRTFLSPCLHSTELYHLGPTLLAKVPSFKWLRGFLHGACFDTKGCIRGRGPEFRLLLRMSNRAAFRSRRSATQASPLPWKGSSLWRFRAQEVRVGLWLLALSLGCYAGRGKLLISASQSFREAPGVGR